MRVMSTHMVYLQCGCGAGCRFCGLTWIAECTNSESLFFEGEQHYDFLFVNNSDGLCNWINILLYECVFI